MLRFYNFIVKGGTVFAGMLLLAQAYCNSVSAQQFTAGRLVVERVGDGNPQSPAGTQIFLDEYTTTGIAGISLALPTVNVASVNRTVASGTGVSEGFMTRSVDGKWLVVPGYDAAPGTPSVASSAANKVITRVDGNGGFASTVVTDASAFPSNSFRGVATTDGSEYWLSGTGTGPVYVAHQGNTTAVSGTEVSGTNMDNRGIMIAGSQLYIAANTGVSNGIYQVGTGLPTTAGSIMTPVATAGITGDPHCFAFVTNGLPVMYVADHANKLVRKYFQSSGSWFAAGAVSVTVGGVATGLYGITGTVVGGVVRLYATTTNIAGSNSRIISFSDATAASTVITGSVVGTTIVGPTSNTALHGITFVPFSVTGIASGTSAVCMNSGTTITVSGNPGTVVTYQKAGVTQLPVTITASGIATFNTGALTANTTFTVISATDGQITQTYSYNVTILVNPLPTVTTSGSGISICRGQSAVLTAGGTLNYSWSPAAALASSTGASVVASPTVTTVFTVTGTDINGCSNYGVQAVNVNPLPIISTGTQVAICIGSSTNLAASGGISYTWAPATGLSSTVGSPVTASPTSTTTYTITGNNSFGCTNTMTNTVTVNLLPTVTASPDVAICNGTSTGLTASGANTYVWFPSTGLTPIAGSSVTARPTSTITYTVVGSDMNGCVNRASVTVTVNSLPAISAGTTTSICYGASASLMATGAVDYMWTPASSLSSSIGSFVVATPTATTTYTVTGTDMNGCVNRTTTSVVVNPLPVVGGTGGWICPGTTTAISGSGAIAYTWMPAAGLSSTVGTMVIANPVSTTIYTVTGTNGYGCTGTAMITVTVHPLPPITAGPGVAICDGSSTTLTATGAITYTWAPGYGLSTVAGSTVMANPRTTTTYTITGIDRCVNSATITVTVNPLPAITAPGATICMGQSATLTASGGVSYTWAPATGLSAVAGSTVSASPTANTNYTVTGTDANGCVKKVISTVLVNLTPAVTTGPTVTICDRSSATLSASGASTYSWAPATGLSSTVGSSVSASPSTSTVYTVTGTSPYGCTNTATLNVNVNSLPSVYAVTGGGTFCAGDIGVPVGLAGSQGGIHYELFVGPLYAGITRTGTGSALDFGHPGTAGFYTIRATNLATSCTDTMSGGAGITINRGPVALPVTGGGGYCPDAPGVHIGLGGSVTGVLYQLYRDTIAIDTPVSGSGTSLDFGLHTIPGTYTVTGVNAGMDCVTDMTGSASVNILPTPPIFTVTGGGVYCEGGTGVHIGIIGSQIGMRYGVYIGSTPMAPSLIGLGTALDFGLFTTPGVYTVTSTNSITGCSDTMSGTATVSINPTPVISGGSYLIVRHTSTTLNVTPAGGTWTSSTPAVATVNSSGVVTGVGHGRTTITYTLPTGCRDMFDVTVNPNLGVSGVAGNVTLTLVPNPNNGAFDLAGTFASNQGKEVFIEIVNAIGQVVYSDKVVVNNDQLNEHIELKNAAPGMYILSVRTETGATQLRFVKE
ncbi:MAG: hypothetical protein K0Q79_3045 [Flavipsychrobacter sp.]|jgi:hypothetical protein|nr:hypothetical protein [Flavipsychrobacter sp.]